MIHLRAGFWTLVVCALSLQQALAAAPANQTDLAKCQKTVKTESARFAARQAQAVATCLDKLATVLIRNNGAIGKSPAQACVTQFRKINDSRALGKSLGERFRAKVLSKCNAVNINDITGKGSPTVPQPIGTKQIDQWCQQFGGDGSIDTVNEWVDCMIATHECETYQGIAERYPRASEWLSAVKPVMQALASPSSDPNKVSDAVSALTTVDTMIDGDADNKPDLACPQPPPVPVCSTACCYIEQSNATFRPTTCFQYTGTASQVSTFKANCAARGSSPPGFWTLSATNGACSAGPTYGIACVVGGAGNNAVAIPKESTCP